MSLVVAAVALTSSEANAALLTVEPAGVSPNGVYVLYLAGESTVFNGVGLSVKPDGDALFLNTAAGNVLGVPRPPGHSSTYRNRFLDADPSEVPESKGWALLGVVTTAQEVAFSGGPLGQMIDTSGESGGKLWLANLMLPPGATATATLQLVNGVDTVQTQTLQFPIPEPGGLAITSLGVLAVLARRRKVWFEHGMEKAPPTSAVALGCVGLQGPNPVASPYV
jgi:hypothetical protein